MTAPTGAHVTYADDDPNGLASIVGALIEQNLARDPRRRRFLRATIVVLSAADADVAASLRIGRGGVEVANGADPCADLEIVTDGHRLLDLAAVPLRIGLPDPFHARGRAVLRELLTGRLRVRGLVRHPARLARLNRLLSAA